MDGIFGVYKPRGMNSHDVVNIVRRKTGIKRVGHGGTLDPLAEGVLVIAVGRENTKLLDQFVKGEKEYIAEIFLGLNSTTDDEQGEKETIDIKNRPVLVDIEKLLKQFVGNIFQTPPQYSSIKINGKPAHRRMRKGQKVEMKPREVVVNSIEILSYEFPILKLKIATGPGVYIRAIARDLGKELSTGGYLKNLIRTKVGKFTIENSRSIDQ